MTKKILTEYENHTRYTGKKFADAGVVVVVAVAVVVAVVWVIVVVVDAAAVVAPVVFLAISIENQRWRL